MKKNTKTNKAVIKAGLTGAIVGVTVAALADRDNRDKVKDVANKKIEEAKSKAKSVKVKVNKVKKELKKGKKSINEVAGETRENIAESLESED